MIAIVLATSCTLFLLTHCHIVILLAYYCYDEMECYRGSYDEDSIQLK